GSAVGGLTADFYEVELRPQPGYQPPKNLTVAIEPGTTNWVPASYDPESTGSVESGYLRVMIQPPEKGQWQLQGEATWREGGETILRPAGYHTVVFKDVTNLATPRSWEVQVIGNQTNEIEGDYAPLNISPALLPELLSLTDATTTAPYL